jgi:hypothetical protein
MIGDALDHVLQITLWIDVIQLACLNKTISDRGAFATRVRSEEQVVLFADAGAAHGARGYLIGESPTGGVRVLKVRVLERLLIGA